MCEKQCKRCNEVKPIDSFGKNKTQSDGLSFYCKSCNSIINKISKEKHRDSINAKRKEAYHADIEVNRAKNCEWHSNNKDKVNANKRVYYAENREKCIQTSMNYQKANPDVKSVYQSRYQKSPKGKVSKNKQARKRRALKRKCMHPNHDERFEAVFEGMRQRLQQCLNTKYAVDHILPLAQGGWHHHGNLQVIPTSLNSRKNDSLKFKHESLIHWTDLPLHLKQ